jgi:hypothetical protein
MPSPDDPLPPEDEAEFLFASLRYLTSVVPEIKEESLPRALRKVFPEDAEVMLKTLAMVEEIESQQQEREKECRREEALKIALLLLRKCLGTISVANEKRIRALSLTQVEELGLAASDFHTSEDLLAWLRAHSGAEKS